MHTIGPLQTIAAPSSTRDPIDMHLTPQFSMGIIFFSVRRANKTKSPNITKRHRKKIKQVAKGNSQYLKLQEIIKLIESDRNKCYFTFKNYSASLLYFSEVETKPALTSGFPSSLIISGIDGPYTSASSNPTFS